MATQIFISWSGKLSHDVASLLHGWIPTVLQSAEPFLSSTDIEKGSRWSDHVAQKLEECGFGIIVLTKANLSAPWILFESGALSKMVGKSHVSALLIDLDLVDVKQPLSQFQNTIVTKEDITRLIGSINRASPTPLKEEVLLRSFNALWPEFDLSLQRIVSAHAASAENVESLGSTDAVSDEDSIKSSVGELIQTVNALSEEIRGSSSASNIRQVVARELRFGRRPAPLPMGLTKDLRASLDELEEKSDPLGDDATFTDNELSVIITRLTRATKYIERLTESRPSYPMTGQAEDPDAMKLFD